MFQFSVSISHHSSFPFSIMLVCFRVWLFVCVRICNASLSPVQTVHGGPASWWRGKQQVVFPFSFSIPLSSVTYCFLPTFHDSVFVPQCALHNVTYKVGLVVLPFSFYRSFPRRFEKARDTCCTIKIMEKWHDKPDMLSSTGHLC